MPPGRAVPLGLAAGLVSALFLLLAGTRNAGALILAGMAPLPVMMAGLGAGPIALGSAVAVALGANVWLGGPAFGIVFAEQVALPSIVMVALALAKPVPPSAQRLVLGLTTLGCAGFAIIFLVLRGEEGGLQGVLRTRLLQFLTELQQQASVQFPQPIDRFADTLAFWAVGAAVASWLLNIAGNGLLAQNALARFDRNLRPSPSLSGLDLPHWTSAVFGVGLAVWWFGSGEVAYLGANLAEILAVPLLLGGLAVVHTAVRRHPARLILLIAIYLLTFLLVVPTVVFVALGIVEQWVGLRRRLTGGGRGEK